jgi:hypothetical protein
MSREVFDRVMNEPGKSHKDYKASVLILFGNWARKFRRFLSD